MTVHLSKVMLIQTTLSVFKNEPDETEYLYIMFWNELST